MPKSIVGVARLILIASALVGAAISYLSSGNAALAGPLSASEKPDSTVAIKIASTAPLSDGEIAYIYMQANLFEVEKAELGKTLGNSVDVKQHGDMVAKDHRGVVKSFEELLKMNGVKPVEPSGSAASVAQHQAVMADLKARSGADFDRSYLIHEVGNHRAVIEAIRTTLLPALKSQALATHMKAVLPAFEHHLAMTIDAAKKSGVSEAK